MTGEEMPKKEKGFVVPAKPASDDPVDRMIHALLKRTADFAQVNKYWAEVKKTEVNERLQRISNRVKKLGGCNYEDFKGLIEDIMQESLPPPIISAEAGKVQFVPFAVVKVTNNPNSHNYPKNTPILIHKVNSEHKGQGVIDIGLEGNWLPEYIKSFVPATAEEVTDFVKKLKESKLGGSTFTKYLAKASEGLAL